MEESNHIRKFMKFQKMHKGLPLSIMAPSSIEARTYQLIIRRVNGLKHPTNGASSLQFSFVITMFLSNGTDRQFFGRSYESPRMDVDFAADGVAYDHREVTVFYNTKIQSSKDVAYLLILELIAYEVQGQNTLRRMTCGWTEISALQLTQAVSKLQLRKGTPRQLLLGQQIQYDSAGIVVLADVVQGVVFENCLHLVPENTLCGLGDEVPGLKNLYVGHDFDLCRVTTIFIQGIQVLVPENIDLEVYKQVQKYRTAKYRVSEDFKQDISITSRKITIGYHNGWTFINSRQFNNFVPLADSRMQVQQNVDSKVVTCRQLEYQGVIDVNNICLIDDAQANAGMLIMQLEYEATFLIQHSQKDVVPMIIAWIPIYINNKIGADEQLDEFMITSGKSITGKQLAALGDIPVKVKATLNLSGGGFQQQMINKIAQPLPQQIQPLGLQPQSQLMIHQQQQQQLGQPQNPQRQQVIDTDIRSQVKLKELEAQMYRLQEENERLRRMNMAPRQEDQQKQQEYIKAIEQLREDNRRVQFTQSKQFERLEGFLKETKTSTSKQPYQPIIQSESYPQHVQIHTMDSYGVPVPQAILRPIDKSQAAIQALIDDGDIESKMNRALQLEEDDEKKDSVIIIQPLSFKQILCEGPIIKQLFMTIRFYDLPTYKTPILKLEYADHETNFQFNIQQQNPLRILLNGDVYNIKFPIDCSTEKYYNLTLDFAKYLFSRNILIDIWDADSMLLYGSVRMGLRQLLRAGKPNNQILGDVDIMDPSMKKTKGTLQILIRNIGKMGQSSQMMDATMYNLQTTNTKLQTRTKIISEKPINRNYVPKSANVNRVEERIQKLKQSNLTHLNQTHKKDISLRTLDEVQKYKEMQKPTLIKNIVQGFIQAERILNVFYGRSEIVPYYFKNTLDYAQTITIIIEDPDSKYLRLQEIAPVTNASEWKFFVKEKNLPEPVSYDMVKVKEVQGKAQYYMDLNPSEEVTFLLKFLTFRQVDPQSIGDPHAAEMAQRKGAGWIEQYIYHRCISILIQSKEGKILDGKRLQVWPHEQILDHTLRFYERENRSVRLVLPQLYANAQDIKPTLHVSDSTVLVDWAQDNNQLRLNLRVGKVNDVRSFNIIAYKDIYQTHILTNINVIVYSLASCDIEVPLGQTVISSLALPSDIHRIIKFFPSDTKVIQFEKPYDQESPILPGKINLIPIRVKTVREGKHTILVNAVDINAQVLYYSWLIYVNSIAQPPSAVYDIRCIEGREFRQQVSYKNQTNYLAEFNITSSSEFIKVLDPVISAGPFETVSFKIKILPNNDTEVKLFLNDTEDRIFDTLLLKIKYIY